MIDIAQWCDAGSDEWWRGAAEECQQTETIRGASKSTNTTNTYTNIRFVTDRSASNWPAYNSTNKCHS
jgi:hypothetical protein